MELNIPEVVWEVLDDDDFIFRFEDYLLRVEQMDKGVWWWEVTHRGLIITKEKLRATTELETKLLAELCFIRHYIKTM